jgi:hypothetical protein
MVAQTREIRDAEAYGAAAARIVVDGIEAAARDEQLGHAVTEWSRGRLYAAVARDMGVADAAEAMVVDRDGRISPDPLDRRPDFDAVRA